jgi:hypothetical protein
VKSPTSTISRVIIEGMIVVIITMEKGVLLLCDAAISSIVIHFSMKEGAIKLQILPVNRKDHFVIQLLIKDQKMSWYIFSADWQ